MVRLCCPSFFRGAVRASTFPRLHLQDLGIHIMETVPHILKIPDHTPPVLRETLLKCWTAKEARRPNAKAIVKRIVNYENPSPAAGRAGNVMRSCKSRMQPRYGVLDCRTWRLRLNWLLSEVPMCLFYAAASLRTSALPSAERRVCCRVRPSKKIATGSSPTPAAKKTRTLLPSSCLMTCVPVVRESTSSWRTRPYKPYTNFCTT